MTQSELFRKSATPWQPHAYQKRSVKFLLEHAAGALFLDPGLGKTAITLATIKLLKQKGLVQKVLLIAPLRVCHSVWPAETQKWKDFQHLRVAVLHGPKKADALASDADIYVINPEGLEWLLAAEKSKTPSGKTRVGVDLRRFKNLGFDTLVIDELSKFKHTNTNRFKALKQVIGTFQRRWGLTGSPAANGLEGLFGQCYMLDQGRSLGQYITQFRLEFFNEDPRGFGWVLREGSEEKIYKRIKPLVLRMSADDYLDMPKLIENTIAVDLPPGVMSIYERLEEDLIAKLDQGLVVASTAAAASIKCRQVASGALYLDPEVQALVKLPKAERDYAELHSVKLDALEDLIEELQGSPVLVAYDFQHSLERLQKRFGKDLPYIGGGVSAKRAAALEKAWNAGELPYLFGHPASIGHGLNLQQAGHHVAWFDPTWDYELYDQFIRRVYRQGNQAGRVFVHHLVARGTIDEAMMAATRSKRAGQQDLFNYLKKARTARQAGV